MISFYY